MQATTAPPSAATVITSQPTVVYPREPSENNWRFQLFDIPDFGLFALSCCCPCIVFGSVAQDIGQSYTLCCLASLCSLLTLQVECNWLVGCLLRERVRRRYRIRGNLVADCCTYCCCYACTLNQAALQAEFENSRHGQNRNSDFSIRLGQRQFTIRSQPAQPVAQAYPTPTSSQPTCVPLLSTTVTTTASPGAAPTMNSSDQICVNQSQIAGTLQQPINV
ncbi:hypothetical protein EG68_03063 [Paragonimus skrjabini miyazakii]|uniref:Uncharacterized protein n=1 Tax=Paragonimus skrjabini miyazakii TaxID=59628 RepID=A0A8S9Z2G4_9TREM|nr:hypothetical protein EG68_03063 [Paragonimus skrjabini miyazakii]